MKISLFKNNKIRTPVQINKPIEILKTGLLTPVKTPNEKNQLPLWSPTIFKDNRSGANALYITMLVYDVDDGTSLHCWRCFTNYMMMVHTLSLIHI